MTDDAADEESFVRSYLTDGVLILRLDRPHKKNAVTRAMYRRLTEEIRRTAGDDGVRAILICGAAGAFCAGNDIKDFVEFSNGGGAHTHVHEFLKALATSPKPLVAAVDGLAIGIGTTMLMHCDLVYCSPHSTFRTPFLDLGITPEAASSLIAPKIMGDQRAFALLVLGDTFDAVAAREANLVYQIVETDVEQAARDAALRLANKPPRALEIGRQLLRGDRQAILDRIDLEVDHFAERLTSTEAKLAFEAFLNR